MPPTPDITGARVWVQCTSISGFHFGQPDYWYAFAGNPNRTPAGGTGVAPPPPPAGDCGRAVERLAGTDRYATAAAISAASFTPGVPVAYVATGANFPDALAAGAAAARRDGPVLLVTSNGVPAATASELARLRPGTIKVIGGSAIVSNGVLDALRGYATSGTAQRISGDNRYATAARVSADTFAAGVPVAYVATGTGFPDALSGVAAAGLQWRADPARRFRSDPIRDSRRAEPPAAGPDRGARRRRRRFERRGCRTHAVCHERQRHTAGGRDRYSTAVAITAATFSSGSTVFVATGVNFPDALGGGPVAGGLPGPLLLVPGTSVPSSVSPTSCAG